MRFYYEIFYENNDIYNSLTIINNYSAKLEALEHLYKLYLIYVLNTYIITEDLKNNFVVLQNYKIITYKNKIRKCLLYNNDKYNSEKNILDFNKNIYEKNILKFEFTSNINKKLQEQFKEFLNKIKEIEFYCRESEDANYYKNTLNDFEF